MPRRILVLDDSLSMRTIIQRSLEQHGYEVVPAADGLEGMAALDRGPYDGMVVDVNMPGLDGIGFVRRARARCESNRVPILMLTTESARSKIEEGRLAGASGWMVKPFHPDRLVATVRRVVP